MKYKVTRADAKTLAEWISLYENKTGEKVEIPKGFRLFYLAERGFAQFKVDAEGKILIIWQLCGDAKFWHDIGEILCFQNGLKCISSVCIRNIRAYMRYWHWDITDEYNNNGALRFICKDQQGRKIIITHKGVEDGITTYWVTHYVNPIKEDGE